MSIRAELEALRCEARALRSLLHRLEERIQDLEDQAGFEVVRAPSPPRESRSEAYRPSGSTPCRASEAPVSSSAASGAFADGSSASQPGPPTSQFRVGVAQGVGRFLAGRLRGQTTGSSGRESLALSSRLYIVCRDAQGKSYNPPIVTSSFARVKQLCFLTADRRDCGASVFIGLPSQAEVRIAIAAADLSCPSLSGDGGSQ